MRRSVAGLVTIGLLCNTKSFWVQPTKHVAIFAWVVRVGFEPPAEQGFRLPIQKGCGFPEDLEGAPQAAHPPSLRRVPHELRSPLDNCLLNLISQ